MIYWYPNLYMDETVKKNPRRCKKRIIRRRPWKRSYAAITLAGNDSNLFEIMETRELFFRRYCYLDIYVIGLAADREEAKKLLQCIVEDVYKEDSTFLPKEYFQKSAFSSDIG